VLLVGASRGLGYAMAAEFAKRGWDVVGTVRGNAITPLHRLATDHPGRIEVMSLDITEADQIAALRDRLAGRIFDILFVNAGTANPNDEIVAEVSTAEFTRVMVTNALGPMRTIETLGGLVAQEGLIGIMSSGQGSVTNNETGGHEVYRATKAALNTCMRSYAARHVADRRALLLMAPGWIRTELGGPNAPFTVQEAIPDIVDVLLAQQGLSGLRYLDRKGRAVPW
jgi:NAD(P)-dependent dehydrogenase (short-subunit alcohol dehydrogenase family)